MIVRKTPLLPLAALVGCALAFFGPVPSLAQDAASVYKSKCQSCHGATGAGRRAIKGSNLLTAEMKNLSDEEMVEGIASGGKKRNAAHAYEKKGVTKEQTQALVKYVRELQQKK